VGQFRNQACPSALSYFGGKLPHGFLRDRAAFAARQGSTSFIDRGAKPHTPALAFFPQSKGLFDRVFLAAQPSRFHGLAGECSLIGCKLDFHCFGSCS
jgi:hypothetical protein